MRLWSCEGVQPIKGTINFETRFQHCKAHSQQSRQQKCCLKMLLLHSMGCKCNFHYPSAGLVCKGCALDSTAMWWEGFVSYPIATLCLNTTVHPLSTWWTHGEGTHDDCCLNSRHSPAMTRWIQSPTICTFGMHNSLQLWYVSESNTMEFQYVPLYSTGKH